MRAYNRMTALVVGCFVVTTLLLYLPNANDDLPAAIRHPSSVPHRPLDKHAIHRQDDRPFAPHQFRNPRADSVTPWPQMDIGERDGLQEMFDGYSFARTTKIDEEMVNYLRSVLQRWYGIHANEVDCTYNETLDAYYRRVQGKPLLESTPADNWERFYVSIGTCDLYRDDKLIDELLHDIATLPVKHVAQMEGGTQIKLVITFANDKSALMKPMRFGRNYETDENHFYFGDMERHIAEIASFHLDRVLGFRRAVPTVGRVMNISSELWANAERKLAKTFFVSPVKNLCFVGKCDYYCDTTHAMCGQPDLKEGSLQVFLPDEDIAPRKHFRSLYRRTYSKRDQVAVWQRDPTFCTWRVKKKPVYAHGRRLLDLIDLHIFDFLMVNQDRHHFEQFSIFDDRDVYPLHFDNGRGFGKTKIDFEDILAPLTQCCVIRPSTLTTLVKFYGGNVSLPMALHHSMSRDPVAPILPAKHYVAIERRLDRILHAVQTCLTSAKSIDDVLMTNYENADVASPDAEKNGDGVQEKRKPDEDEEDDK